MLENIESKKFKVLDARSKGRFDGIENEPRPNLRSGHIPNSICIPFLSLIDTNTMKFHSPDKLKLIFDNNGIDVTDNIITTCGSGVTAACISFALQLVREHERIPKKINCVDALYDGSFAEWGKSKELGGGPVVSLESSKL